MSGFNLILSVKVLSERTLALVVRRFSANLRKSALTYYFLVAQ